MNRKKSVQAAIGFRVKSGWAAVVLLVGPVTTPRVVDSRRLDLSDPANPDCRQPYHEGFDAAPPDSPRVPQRVRSVQQYSRRSVSNLLADCRRDAHKLRSAAVVVGSEIDPATIANPHIRAHALEGQLFRSVVETPVKDQKLPCVVLVEKLLYTTAAKQLGLSEQRLKRAAADLGRDVKGGWRAEQKAAAVAAWLVLARYS